MTLLTHPGAQPPADDERAYLFPLSFAQQRLWFTNQLVGPTSALNITMPMRIRGELHVGALRRALGELVQRHEALRTCFRTDGGEPAQVVAPDLSIDLDIRDLGPLPESHREAQMRAMAQADVNEPFDLTRCPLFRLHLIRMAPREHVLVFTIHHILWDGWSTSLFLSELAALHEAFSEGRPSPLAELPIQYADYAVWQRQWLAQGNLEREMAYWKGVFPAAPPVLELPYDAGCDPDDMNGEHRLFTLPTELSRAIRRLSKREGATLFMTLLAAYAVVLYRYTGQTDVVVGSPLASRTRKEVEGLLGCFINPLPLRLDLSGSPTFREVLRRSRAASLGAFSHQEVPFDELVRTLHPHRDPRVPPLFQVLFLVQNFWLRASGPRLDIEKVPIEPHTFAYPLSLEAEEDGEGVTCRLEYLSRYATLCKHLPDQYRTLLEAATADPDTPIDRLALLSEPERRTILGEYRGPVTAVETGRGFHTLFEREADRIPGAAAVVAGPRRVTYGELEVRSNRLAHRLAEMGIGRGGRVAVLLERHEGMVVAALGVLKAGAAYVPLDPRYPLERLRDIFEDARPAALVTQASLAADAALGDVPVLRLDADADTISRQPDIRPAAGVTGDDAAYVIFTSGSTGRPKGTVIRHGGLVNQTAAWLDAYRLREDTRVHLQMASMAFDVFTGDLARALASGGCLAIAPQELLLEPERLYDLMKGEGVDAAEFVPVVLRQLAAYLEATGQRLDFMRLLVAGSDRWFLGECRRLGALCGPQTRLVNSYGLTEATIDSTWYECSPQHLAAQRGDGLVPIGRPFANTRAYIVDAAMNPAPLGVPGELCIGGPGLADGYLDRPDETARRFIADPFSDEPGARLYRTGDRARWLAGGDIEFLGRGDNQVKLRGYRVELSEIEALLLRTPGGAVRQAAVLLREDHPGDQRLTAYIAHGDAPSPKAADLRRHVGDHLPQYMTPAAWVMLEALPVNASGKIDRRGLPDPEAGDAATADEYVEPATPTQRSLAALYARVLKTPRVGARDDFFALGGHSLLATQLVSQVRQAMGVEMPLRRVFERPVLADLAAAIDEDRPTGDAPAAECGLPPVTRRERGPATPQSFAQQRLWFLHQFAPTGDGYHIPSATRLRGDLDAQALRRALFEIVRRHESLRTTFANHGGEPVQIVAPSGEPEWEARDLSDLEPAARDDAVARCVAGVARRPFDLTRGPLLRAHVLTLDPHTHVLATCIHHIVSDAWSAAVLMRELTVLYDAFRRGEPSPLAPLAVQYADFALWQREHLTGSRVQTQVDYWRAKLAHLPTLDLPLDHPRRAGAAAGGGPAAQTPFALNEADTADLMALCRGRGCTLFMAALATLRVLLQRRTGQDDIVVGSPIANRTRAETEGLIGFFMNTLVLRTDLSGDPTFNELLARERETALAAYAHQDVPFERLVEALAPRRDLTRTPLYQVQLVLQNAPAADTALPGLTLEPMPGSAGATKFDLNLHLVQSRGRLVGALTCNAALIDAATAAEMSRQYAALLAQAARHPGLPISRLRAMPAAQRDQVLAAFNRPLDSQACASGIDTTHREPSP